MERKRPAAYQKFKFYIPSERTTITQRLRKTHPVSLFSSFGEGGKRAALTKSRQAFAVAAIFVSKNIRNQRVEEVLQLSRKILLLRTV